MSKLHRDEHLQQAITRGHETRDANVKWVVVSGVGLLALILGTLALMYWTRSHYVAGEMRHDAPRPALSRAQPAGPLLQANPYGDLKSYQEQEQAVLNGYWRHYSGEKPLDRVTIPIERAMELIVERGLPVAKEPPRPTTAPAGLPPRTQPG